MTRPAQRLADLRTQGKIWADFVTRWTSAHRSWGQAEEHWLKYVLEVTELRELAHLTGNKLITEVELVTQRWLMVELRKGSRCKFCPVRLKKQPLRFLARLGGRW